MALTYNQISAITEKKFIPKMYDNIFDSDPLLQRSKKKGWHEKISGGEKVVIPLGYAQATACDWYSGADTLDTTDNEVITGAEYDWKQIHATISITRRDELKNAGDTQILNFVKQKTMIAEKTLKDKLGDGLYHDGTTAKSIIGTEYMLSTSNSPGGIDSSTYSWWQPQLDSSSTILTMSALQDIYQDCTINNESPTVIMATRSNYNRYYSLLQPQQRFMDSETAKGGFSSLMFNGTPFIAGSKVPTNHIQMLNENYLHLQVHRQEDMRFEKFQKPINQNVKVGHIYWMGIFGVSNLRMQGGLTAIAG